MNERRAPISTELRPFVDRAEAEEIDRLAERLADERPLPAPGFRAALRVGLEARRPREAWRPQRLGLAIATFGGSGMALLAIATLGVTGAGPLGN